MADTLKNAIKTLTFTNLDDTDSTVKIPTIGIHNTVLGIRCKSDPNIVCIPYRASSAWWVVLRNPKMATVPQGERTYEIKYM